MKASLTDCWFRILFFSMLLASCSGRYTPPVLTEKYGNPPPEPDYSMPSAWAVLPTTKDNADKAPEQTWLRENQEAAEADVFFIHPTSYLKRTERSTGWNADIYDPVVNDRTSEGSLLYQASVFNHSARIYAPRYRQAFIYSYFTNDREDAGKAFDLAYSDVKRAFEYYMANYNQGRPVIIASHSQGTTHAIRLLKEEFDNKPLKNKLIAAYLIGMPVYDTLFKNIPPCTDSLQTGCFVSWRTFARDYFPPGYVRPVREAVCTNPLTWKTDSVYAPRELNRGGVLRNFDRVIPGLSDAQVLDGVLRINKPYFKGRAFYNFKNYHIVDYNLFYINIRENVAERVKSFQIKNARK